MLPGIDRSFQGYEGTIPRSFRPPLIYLCLRDLAAKLITSPIYEYYSDYEGPSDYPTGCAYMESKFRPLYRNEAVRPLIVHFTCATCVSPLSFYRAFSRPEPTLISARLRSDTEQLKVVFAAVEESILKAAMEDLVRCSLQPSPNPAQ